jgi:hypothetical protein
MAMADGKERLVERLKAKVLNGTCAFVLCNDTPEDWDVVVVEGGAKFFYSDSTDDTDGPKPLNLPTGACYSFFSGDSSKCVKQVFLAINVTVPGEGPQTMTYQTEMAPDGQCWVQQGVTLGQTDSINEAQIGPRSLTRLLSLQPKA